MTRKLETVPKIKSAISGQGKGTYVNLPVDPQQTFIPYSLELNTGQRPQPSQQPDETPSQSFVQVDSPNNDSFWPSFDIWGSQPEPVEQQPVIEIAAPSVQTIVPPSQQAYFPSEFNDPWSFGSAPVVRRRITTIQALNGLANRVEPFGFWGALLTSALTAAISVGGTVAAAAITKKPASTTTATPAVNTTTTYIVTDSAASGGMAKQPQAAAPNNTALYVGFGVAALLIIVLMSRKKK